MTDKAKDIGTGKYFTMVTYGCQMNENDSERLAGQLKQVNYTYTDKTDEADLILINTCCVRESAEKKIYGKIGELKRLKAVKPELIIGIVGCMAQKDREKIIKKAPHVDLVMGTNNLHKLVEVITEVANSKEHVVAVWEQSEESAGESPVSHKGKVAAYVPIMYGCNNFCTYCIVPYVRGRERSRQVSEIVREITALGQEGFKDITLLGQNVNSYGKDHQAGTTDFAGLLKAVDKIDTIERIRYMTSHPRDMNKDVIEAIAGSQKICEHFHLPIQAGSDILLKRMNRGYTTEYYRELIKSVRTLVPNASITTDLIVGFPGETDELFQETLAFIKEIQFDAAYTFLYSQRSGTPAATMPEQVPLPIKKARLKELMDAQNEISLALNKKLEGQTLEVLVEGDSKNDAAKFMGRTRTNKLVLWEKTGKESVGDLVNIKITHAQTWLLKGQAII
ncbi:MAG: tRNA (N6-isopentenyl adenosine(37)-C2)-methylthiotransferase MiaB [Pelosinus sp.]|nr:tRNA (N6-isopentenyl adenosine(37)-C2)-methylthiotransferase MiaB [Pelosinus sp.]